MYNKIMRRMNERVERYHGNNGSHNYRSREGANIPKQTSSANFQLCIHVKILALAASYGMVCYLA